MLRRKGAEFLYFWETTKKGRWHVHWVVNKYLDVNKFRPWMMKRGWGQQMRAERVEASPARVNGDTWTSDESNIRRMVTYLIKYCTKSVVDAQGSKKKVFGASSESKVGTVAFRWCRWINPTSYLYYYGRQLWCQLNAYYPTWKDHAAVVRYGVEATSWLDVDPWWMPSGP